MRRPHSIRMVLGGLLLAPMALASCSTTPVSSLTTGSCFEDARAGEGGVVRRVATVDCSVEHEGEVVGIELLAAGDFPGAEEMNAAASRRCPELFADYTGIEYADSDVTLVPMLPDEEGWEAGDRSIICVAVSDDPTTTSLAG